MLNRVIHSTKLINFFRVSEVHDSIYLLFLQGTNYIIPLIAIPYLMKILGASYFGIFSFSFSFVQYFLLIVDFGFNMSATKRIATSNKKEMNRIFSATLYAKSLLLVLSLFIMISFFYFDILKEYRLAILCFVPLLFANTFTFFWLFQGLGKVRTISIINTISKCTILPLTFVFVKDSTDVYIGILIQSGVYVFSCILSNAYIIKYRLVNLETVSIFDIKYEIKESFPLFLSTAATSVHTQLFVIILGFTCTSQIVGCYSAAERIMRSSCFFLYTPICQAFFPKIAKIGEIDKSGGIELVKKLFIAMLIIMAVLSFSLFSFSDVISNFLGKSEYSNLSIIIKMIAFIPIAIGCAGVLGQMGLIALGSQSDKRYFRNTYLLIAPISLIIVLILSFLWELYGCILSLVITECAVFISMYYKFFINYHRRQL